MNAAARELRPDSHIETRRIDDEQIEIRSSARDTVRRERRCADYCLRHRARAAAMAGW
jgi:hypothetical protein